MENKNYLDELYELRHMLKTILNKTFLQNLVELAELIDKSYVDSYQRIKKNSHHGDNCGYAVKAKEMFLTLQEAPISSKITHIYKTFIESK